MKLKRKILLGLGVAAIGLPLGIVIGSQASTHEVTVDAAATGDTTVSGSAGGTSGIGYATGGRFVRAVALNPPDWTFEDAKQEVYVDIPQPTFGYVYDEERWFGPLLTDTVIPANVVPLQTLRASYETTSEGGFGGWFWTPGGSIGGGGGGYWIDNPGGGGPGAIPEPSTWACLVVGFGAIGALLRGRRGTKRSRRGCGASF